MVGCFLLCYSLTTAIAATMRIFRLTRVFVVMVRKDAEAGKANPAQPEQGE